MTGPISAAEKMRRYRERLKTQNPEKLEQQKKKNLARMNSKYKYKKISEMTETERVAVRNKWKEQKQKQKLKKKNEQNANNVTSAQNVGTSSLPLSPEKPKSSSPATETTMRKKKIISLMKYAHVLRNSRDKLRSELNDAQRRIKYFERAFEAARKKLYRFRKYMIEEKKKYETESDKLKVRNEVLEASLKLTYKSCKNNQEKKLIKQIAKNQDVINNQVQAWVSGKIGVRIRKTKSKKTLSRIRKSIVIFFNRDDVSRATAGKRECRTLKKEKQQIRYLNNSLRVLYEKFKTEGGVAAFSTFCRFKPFYILTPSINNRNTCLCTKHSNMAFKINALKRHKVIDFCNTQDLLKKVTCDVESINCMYGKCDNCSSITLDYNLNNILPGQTNITWQVWETENHKYKKNTQDGEQEFKTKKTVKSIKHGTVQELISCLESDIAGFKIHSFNMSHQSQCYKTCIESLSDNELAIHCDFSQNYECKMNEEVQSMHFGASKTQVTLHTGVIFFKGGQKSFCSVSPSNVHQPHAIWAHLKPVIDLGKTLIPTQIIKRVHIFSDGPSSQYRQKNNFYLINYFSSYYNIELTWSFFESGHGKGVADAIGGVVKRALDRQVSYGRDIISATDVHDVLKSFVKSVAVFYINETEIETIKKLVPKNEKTVKGTMNIHQVTSLPNDNCIHHRILSCFCSENQIPCNCYDPLKHTFVNSLKTDQIIKNNGKRTDMLNIPESSIVSTIEITENNCDGTAILDIPESKILSTTEITENNCDGTDILNIPESSIVTSISDCILSDIDLTSDLPVLCLEDIDLPEPTETKMENKDYLRPVRIIKTKEYKANEKKYVDFLSTKIRPHISTLEINKRQINKSPKKSKNCIAKQDSTIPMTMNERKVTFKQPQQNKSLTCIVKRQLTCNKCKNPSTLNDLAKCMACKKYYCLTCTEGSNCFDYICNICFGEE